MAKHVEQADASVGYTHCKGGAGGEIGYLQFTHGVLDGSLGVHAVHVVQVNEVCVQPLQ